MTQAEDYYRQVGLFQKYLNFSVVSSYYLFLIGCLGLVNFSQYVINNTNSYLILIVVFPFCFCLWLLYLMMQKEAVDRLISFTENNNKKDYKNIISRQSLDEVIAKRTWKQSFKIEVNKKANFIIWVCIFCAMIYSKRNAELWILEVCKSFIKVSFFIHVLWDFLQLIEPRDSKYWQKKQYLSIPRLGYSLLNNEQSFWYDRLLSKIYKYEVEEEKEKAALSLIKLRKIDDLSHSFLIYALIAKTENNRLSTYLHNSCINFSNWEYFFIVERIMFHELNLRKISLKLSALFAKSIIRLGEEAFNAWDFALVGNKISALKSLHYKGVEQQLIQEKYPLIYLYQGLAHQFSQEKNSLIPFKGQLKAETKKYFQNKYNKKNWDILKFLGGWQSNYLIAGKVGFPQGFYNFNSISDWGFENKRVEKIIQEKAFVDINSLEILGGSNNTIETNFKVVNTPMLMILNKIVNIGIDNNLIANFIEEANFNSAALYNASKLWNPVSYQMIRGDAQSFVQLEGVFYGLIVELIARYGEKKALKIIKNSLSIPESVWLRALELMLRIKSTPDLFGTYKFPDKVKNLDMLRVDLEWVMEHTQNPNLNLNQEKISKIHKKELGFYTIIVPEKNKELIEAGRSLKVCVANGFFLDKIIQKESYVAFISLGTKVAGIVEIDPKGEILQAKAEQNQNLNPYLVQEFKRAVDENI